MSEALYVLGLRPEGCSRHHVRRFFTGELAGAEAQRIKEHVAGCDRCRAELAAIEREAGEFAKAVPYEAFEGRVLAKTEARPRGRSVPWRSVSLALAACLVVAVAGPLVGRVLFRGDRNLTKGGAGVELFVKGNGAAARVARDMELLYPGERVMVGYQSAGKKYLAVISVDEAGQVTPLFPESGASLPADPGPAVHLLPDSVEFTGHGYERVVTLFTDQPVAVEALVAAAKREFARAGSVERMGYLGLAGEESARMVRKP